MDAAMDDDSRLRADSTATIEVNPSNRAASVGISSDYDL
jgi:hypothetical protein